VGQKQRGEDGNGDEKEPPASAKTKTALVGGDGEFEPAGDKVAT
jgi:hypothetical protein